MQYLFSSLCSTSDADQQNDCLRPNGQASLTLPLLLPGLGNKKELSFIMWFGHHVTGTYFSGIDSDGKVCSSE